MEDLSRIEKWRLILGKSADEDNQVPLEGDAQKMGDSLDALYDNNKGKRRGGLGDSAPKVNRWLGDIRKYFSSSVVQFLQKDALDRLGLQEMLLQPELLETLQPDVNLASTLISLNKSMPNETRATAKLVVKKVVDELIKKLQNPLRESVTGALSRSIRNRRPKFQEIDWQRTIRQNLKHYQHTHKTIVPHQLIGMGRKGQQLKNIILCVDQSGSMGTSVVYSGVFGAVLASLPSTKTQMVVFDTAVTDLTQHLKDPVDLLFGVQLGGGTDINKALAYCQTLITNPSDTVLVLISDLYEGGNEQQMLHRAHEIKESGVQVVALLALNDEGAPSYDRRVASAFASIQIPAFACTPDQFPSLMATAIQKSDIHQWMNRNDIIQK